MLTQIRRFANGWAMEIRYGKRRTYKLTFNGHPLPVTFYTEQALKDWAADMGLELFA